jgi:fluoroquinolone resistance protein
MNSNYTVDKYYEKEDFTVAKLPNGDYENCTFLNCEFSSSDLSKVNFINCIFKHCNLSLAKINQASFRNVAFEHCKLLGLHFENCNDFLFEVNFQNCLLNLSSFFKLKMKKTKFIKCQMNEVDFTNSDLGGAYFDDCDLLNSTFEHTNLEKADLRGAYHFSIDPELNKIAKAKVSQISLAGFLDKYDLIIE